MTLPLSRLPPRLLPCPAARWRLSRSRCPASSCGCRARVLRCSRWRGGDGGGIDAGRWRSATDAPLVDFRKAWRAACKAAGFSGIVPHDLRRSAARNAVRSGVPEQVAMELGGWRTRSVFARYNVTSESDLADAVERVSRYVTERAAERPKPKVEPLSAQRRETA